jgi:hypothetical protein
MARVARVENERRHSDLPMWSLEQTIEAYNAIIPMLPTRAMIRAADA